MTEQEIKNRNKMLYREEVFSPAEKQKHYLFFTRKGAVLHTAPDFSKAIQLYLWSLDENFQILSDFVECLSKREYPNEIGGVIQAVNDFIRNDDETILYFVDLDDGVVYKNPNEYLFESSCKYYKELADHKGLRVS